MSGQAWYRQYAADFLVEVQGMGGDMIAAYIVILNLVFARGGRIAADPRHLAGIIGCSPRLAASLANRLVEAEKIALIDGFWTSFSAEKEIENSAKFTRNQREAGAKGGRSTAENNARAKENNDLNAASLKPLHYSTLQDSTEEKKEHSLSVPKKAPRAASGTPLTQDFICSEKWLDYAVAKRNWSRADAKAEAASFVDYWSQGEGAGRRKGNWSLAWQNWVGRAHRESGGDNGTSGGGSWSETPTPGRDFHGCFSPKMTAAEKATAREADARLNGKPPGSNPASGAADLNIERRPFLSLPTGRDRVATVNDDSV